MPHALPTLQPDLPLGPSGAEPPVRISSTALFFYKRVFPKLWFGFLAFFLCLSLPHLFKKEISAWERALLLIAPLGMAAVGYGLLKWFVLDLVDEVWDAGNHLIVKNKGKEIRIALEDFCHVSYDGFVNPPRVTLLLRESSEFGPAIYFMPPFRFFPYSMPPIAKVLIERIDATRRKLPDAESR